MLTVASVGDCTIEQPPKKKMRTDWRLIAFGDEDLEGMIQPHDDAFGSHCTDKRFLGENGDDRPGKQGRRDVPGLIQRTRVEESGFNKV